MGNACCNGSTQRGDPSFTKHNIKVVGNLEDPEELFHGPSPHDAVRVVSQIERIRQAHKELLDVGYSPSYKDWEL